MSTFKGLLFTSVLAAVLCFTGAIKTISCDSPQYVELGKSGTIHCLFHDKFFGVFWYNTTEYALDAPLVDYQNNIKRGLGYTSGEFDIHANGSLIINNVSLEHEHTFKVIYLHSDEDEPVLIDVSIVVVVKPSVSFPVFRGCGNISNVCFAIINTDSLECSVNEGRPPIPLHIVARKVNNDIRISDDALIVQNGVGYTSSVITSDAFKFSTFMALLVCKAASVPGILEYDESYLLAQNGHINLPSTDVAERYFEVGSRMNLVCTDVGPRFIVWKKCDSLQDKNSQVLLYSVSIGERVIQIFADDVTLEDNTSLIIPVAEVKDRGYYYCLFGDGVTDGLKIYQVIIFVYPTPAHPIVDGCNHQQYCVLETEYSGSLRCTVKGIRPSVQLEWQAFHNDDISAISFSNDRVTIKDNGDTFDVILTSTYTVNDKSRDRLTIECKAPPSNEVPFRLSTKIDILFIHEKIRPTDKKDLEATPSSLFWIIPVSAVLVVLVIILGTLVFNCLRKRYSTELKSAVKDENTSMLPVKTDDSKTIKDLKYVFLKNIKEKYKDWYNAVQPITYIKDRLYCVDKVFVEGGIEFLESVEGVGRRGVWKSLESYENVFNVPQVSSKRRLLEGEPGYGKSTVALQFAYDWCNPKPTSALKDVETLIMLRLRQLGGVPSIYNAIRRFILPRDTLISESDIEVILRNSKSVVVILDGFDEYPDQDSPTITDVMTIIARQMFQDFEVVITTRSSFLPKNYPPLTKRIRLTGFDDEARRYYIRKAVVGDNNENVKRIEGYLEENPILSDLCQVPLLFVIFAHMTYESEQFRKLDSVTSFFRYMISCFHSHMRNKMEDENVRKYELFETDHQDLDKLAFKAFSGKSQKIVWKKDEMRRYVGQKFYDQYIRIGILVEEEGVDINDSPGVPITEHVQYKTKVRFYHKLFCEWYAAHYLSDYIQQYPNLDLSDYLQNLDPFDVQYLYRFACGLNPNTAEKIIDYLKNIEGGDKFAILCILEKTGKIDNIKETIRQLCNEGVIISGHDSLLLQRSSLQLLEIAARNDIPVDCVILYNCLQSVDLSIAAIRTTSGLVLTSRIPVRQLEVSMYNREMTKEEAIVILEFSAHCSSLKCLRFNGSVPCRSFKSDSTLSTLKSKNVQVLWQMFKDDPKYILNLNTGRWQDETDGKEPTKAEFQNMRSKFHGDVKTSTDEIYKHNMKRMRESLRQKAEERTITQNKLDEQ